MDYSPYGQVQRKSRSFSPLIGFAQLPWDANLGLAVSATRLYDPQVGRWLSRDPLGEDAGINLFAYVNGSPTIAVDPEGLQSSYSDNPFDRLFDLVVGGIVGGAGAAVDYLINNPLQFSSIFPASSNPAPNSTPSPTPGPSSTARPTTGNGGSQDPCNRANRTHAKVRDRLRRENEGYESGQHDKFPSAMRNELNRLANEAEANGDAPKYVNRLREIANTYGKRAQGHRGGGPAGQGRR